MLIRNLARWGFDGLCAGNPGLDFLEEREPVAAGEAQQTSGNAVVCLAHPLVFEADSSANIFNQAALLYYQSIGAAAATPSLELSGHRLQPLLELAARTG